MKATKCAFGFFLITFLWYSCRKTDNPISSQQIIPSESTTNAFLELPADADPLLSRIVAILRKKESAQPFIANLMASAGVPKWSYAEMKLPADGQITGADVTINSRSVKLNSDPRKGSKDTTVLVPFVFPGKRKVNSFLVIHLSDTMRLDFFQGKNCARYGYEESDKKVTARKIAMRCMLFDHRIFEIDTFRITDKKLARAFSGGRDTTGLFIYGKQEISETDKIKPDLTISVEICTGGSWLCDPNMSTWNTYTTDHCPLIYVGGSCTFQWFDFADPTYPTANFDAPIAFTTGGGSADGTGWTSYDPYYGRAPALVYTFNTTAMFVSDEEAQWLYDNKSKSTILYNLIYSTQIDESVDAGTYFIENVLTARLLFAEEFNNLSGGPYDANYAEKVLVPTLQLPSVIPIGFYVTKWATMYTTNCALLKLEHPDWGTWKIRWYASRATLQFGLDVIGLVPVVGTVANLVNGTIYAVNGEGVNASLSVLASIPIAGWVSSGVKFAARGENLMFKAADGFIKFTRDQDAFRRALGLVKGDGWIAHHLIPFGLADRPLVQKAAEGGFHINDVLNGLVVTSLQQSGSHPQYDAKVIASMQNIITSYGGIANMTSAQAISELTNLINRIKTEIVNHPGVPLNDLIF